MSVTTPADKTISTDAKALQLYVARAFAIYICWKLLLYTLTFSLHTERRKRTHEGIRRVQLEMVRVQIRSKFDSSMWPSLNQVQSPRNMWRGYVKVTFERTAF